MSVARVPFFGVFGILSAFITCLIVCILQCVSLHNMSSTWYYFTSNSVYFCSVNPLNSNAYTQTKRKEKSYSNYQTKILLLLLAINFSDILKPFESMPFTSQTERKEMKTQVLIFITFRFSNNIFWLYFSCFMLLLLLVLELALVLILNRCESAKACLISLASFLCICACLRVVRASRNCDEHPKWE